MEGHDGLGPAALRRLVERLGEYLAARAEELNELNVFPVADADTGTNLADTLRAVRDDLEDAPTGDVPRVVSRAALMGAKGNSGIVMSQILRGIAEHVEAHGPLSAGEFAQALGQACEYAYEAVEEPVEGTMLTAIRVAAASAREVDGQLTDVVPVVHENVHEAVESTTEQLPELRAADVVDAGARGVELLFAALEEVVTGSTAELGAVVATPERAPRAASPDTAKAASGRYEVVLTLPAADIERMRSVLAEIGGSVDVATSGGMTKAHVHTDEVDAVVDAAESFGPVADMEVTDLEEQVAATET